MNKCSLTKYKKQDLEQISELMEKPFDRDIDYFTNKVNQKDQLLESFKELDKNIIYGNNRNVDELLIKTQGLQINMIRQMMYVYEGCYELKYQ